MEEIVLQESKLKVGRVANKTKLYRIPTTQRILGMLVQVQSDTTPNDFQLYKLITTDINKRFLDANDWELAMSSGGSIDLTHMITITRQTVPKSASSITADWESRNHLILKESDKPIIVTGSTNVVVTFANISNAEQLDLYVELADGTSIQLPNEVYTTDPLFVDHKVSNSSGNTLTYHLHLEYDGRDWGLVINQVH